MSYRKLLLKIIFGVFLLNNVFVAFAAHIEKSSLFHSYTPENGDIFFQEGKKNPFTEAVQSVTSGYKGAKLSHVGILAFYSRTPYIIEAKDKVRKTPLKKFLERSKDDRNRPRVIVGRVKTQYIKLVPKAVKTAKSLVGLPYNDTFNIKDNKAFYCSQLVYYCFKKANMGKMLFKLHPMTFRKPGTKQIFKIWKEYFKKLKTSVPEGAPGLNPGGMSKSKVLNIVYIYGNITGMKNEK